MKRVILIFGFILMSMNLMLWVNGEFTNAEVVNSYPSLPSGLQDINTIDQNNLTLTDTNGTAIGTQGTDFFATVLDFIETIPVLGPLLTLFRFAFDFVANITFGITFLAIKWNLPIQYIVFVGALNFAIVSIGLLEIVLDFTRARGGVR